MKKKQKTRKAIMLKWGMKYGCVNGAIFTRDLGSDFARGRNLRRASKRRKIFTAVRYIEEMPGYFNVAQAICYTFLQKVFCYSEGYRKRRTNSLFLYILSTAPLQKNFRLYARTVVHTHTHTSSCFIAL